MVTIIKIMTKLIKIMMILTIIMMIKSTNPVRIPVTYDIISCLFHKKGTGSEGATCTIRTKCEFIQRYIAERGKWRKRGKGRKRVKRETSLIVEGKT